MILLSGAGLLIRSFQRVQSTDRGFDSENVLLLQVDLPGTYDTTAKMAAFFTEAARRIRALPGVVAVGAISDFFIHRQPDYHVALGGLAAKARRGSRAAVDRGPGRAGLLRSDADPAAARPAPA